MLLRASVEIVRRKGFVQHIHRVKFDDTGAPLSRASLRNILSQNPPETWHM